MLSRDTLSAWFPVVLLALAFLWLWPNLAHPSITSWDEGAHQAVTRGIFDTGVPTILPTPLEPVETYDWMRAEIFLHKPPLPFFLGALLMRLIGITPLALRLISFVSAFLTAFGIYAFGRRLVGAWPAALVSSAFLALPFGLTLVQGYQFGDVTDCSLLAFSVLSVCVLAAALERDSLRLALVGGALCGLAFLCKSLLALTPVGIAAGLALLGARGLGPRIRLGLVLAFVVAAIAVAAPWTVYSALKWPVVFRVEARFLFGFLSDTHRPFSRPFVAIVDPVLALELAPWPVMLFIVAGLWLIRAALERRDLRTWLLCLWFWGELIPLALARVKVPAHAWGAVAAALLAVALLLRDSRTRPWLSGAAVATFGTALAVRLTSGLFIRHVKSDYLPQATAKLGVIEGLILAALGALLALGLARRVDPAAKWIAKSLWAVELGLALWVAVFDSPLRLEAERTKRANQNVDCYTDELGRALDRLVPDRSILFYPPGATDPPCCYEQQSLIFYSGRMVYLGTPHLLALAREQRYHRYLVSGAAQSYQPVAGIPAASWLRAYDLEIRLPAPAPPPSDLTAIDVHTGSLHFFGMAAGPGDSSRDRYVFYAETDALFSHTPMAPVDILFSLAGGARERAQLDKRHMVDAPDFSRAWFTFTLAGPPRADLTGLQLDGIHLPLP